MKELDPGTKPPHHAYKEMQAWSLDEGPEHVDSHLELELIVQGLMLLVPGNRTWQEMLYNDKGQVHSSQPPLWSPLAQCQGTGHLLQPGQRGTAAIREHLLPG